MNQLTDEDGYYTIGRDTWLANNADPAAAWRAECDAGDAYEEAQTNLEKWVAAEETYRRECEHWLDTATRLWLKAEREYKTAAEAWLAAEACPLCDGRLVHAFSDPSPLLLIPVHADAFYATPLPGAQHFLKARENRTGHRVLFTVCQHDLDANNAVIKDACDHAYDNGTWIVKSAETNLTQKIQTIETTLETQRQNDIDFCGLCDQHGTQLGDDDNPVMLRQLNDDYWDVEDGEEFCGEPVPLQCHHNIGANITEYLDTDRRDLRVVSSNDVRPELTEAWEKAHDLHMKSLWLAAERDYKQQQAERKADERAEELELMAGLITDRLASKLDAPW
jgi:hypothetical protein